MLTFFISLTISKSVDLAKNGGRKKILVHPKCNIFFCALLDCSYFDIVIATFGISLLLLVKLSFLIFFASFAILILCFICHFNSLLLFLIAHSLQISLFELSGQYWAIYFSLLLAIALNRVKKRDYWRPQKARTIERANRKEVIKQMYETNTRIAATFASRIWRSDDFVGSNREKIDIAILEKLTIW